MNSLQKMYECDPLSAFFLGRLKWPPTAAVLAILALINLPILAASFFLGTLWTAGSTRGLFNDYGWWVFQFISFPATYFGLFLLPRELSVISSELTKQDSPILSDSGPDFRENEFKRYMTYAYSRITLPAIAAIVAIGMWLLFIPDQLKLSSWQSATPVVFWFVQAVWFLTFAVGLLLIWRGLVAVWWLNDLFRRKPKVQLLVLHPDGAGGVACLGRFSVRVCYLIAIYGAAILIGNMSSADIKGIGFFQEIFSAHATRVLIVLHVILSPVMFFLPMAAAHRAMRDAKKNFLEQLAKSHNMVLKQLQEAVCRGHEVDSPTLRRLNDLQKLHSLTARFPVWPFNTANLVWFSSSILFPVFMSVLTKLLLSELWPRSP